jgi:lipoprotein-anchoring transpeptidase ErfK/SrfK
VLTLQSVVTQGPAANPRRLLLCAVAGTAALLASGCGTPPPPDVDGVRRVMRSAIALARPAAPQQARYLERLVADAEIATAGEIADPSQRGRAQAAWLRAVIAARNVTADVRAHRDTARRRYDGLLPAVHAGMARARAELREAGMGRREASAMERATTSYKTALRLAAAGQFGPAADKLEKAREMTAVINASFRAVHRRFEDPKLLAQWRSWADSAVRESRLTGKTVIVVDKLRRRLTVYRGGERVVSFSAELGANGLQRKAHSGDRATPEGAYRVVDRKEGRRTNFYKALLIDYPNDEDRERFANGKRVGTIPRRAGIGSLIEIHGEGGEGKDWTDGCVALVNQDMDWVYDRAPVGTLVVIVGTV